MRHTQEIAKAVSKLGGGGEENQYGNMRTSPLSDRALDMQLKLATRTETFTILIDYLARPERTTRTVRNENEAMGWLVMIVH
jgi:hypothetical protein